jgi:hypothetical protein
MNVPLTMTMESFHWWALVLRLDLLFAWELPGTTE